MATEANRPRSGLDRPTTNDIGCRWYVAEDGHTRGPMRYEELLARAREGRLSRSHYVWRPGFEQWIAVSARPDLCDAMPSRPTLGLVPASLEAAALLRTDELRLSRDLLDERPDPERSAWGDAGLLDVDLRPEGPPPTVDLPRLLDLESYAVPSFLFDSAVSQRVVASEEPAEDPDGPTRQDRRAGYGGEAVGCLGVVDLEAESALSGESRAETVEGAADPAGAPLDRAQDPRSSDHAELDTRAHAAAGGASTGSAAQPLAIEQPVNDLLAEWTLPREQGWPPALEPDDFMLELRGARRTRWLLVAALVALVGSLAALVWRVETVERASAWAPSVNSAPPKRSERPAAPAPLDPLARSEAEEGAASERGSAPVHVPERVPTPRELAFLNRGSARPVPAPRVLVSQAAPAPRAYRVEAPEPSAYLDLPVALPPGLSDDRVGPVVSGQLTSFARCARFDRLAAHLPPGSAVALTVRGDGMVEEARARGAPSEVERCLERAARALVFSPFARPAERVEIRFARAGTVRARVVR